MIRPLFVILMRRFEESVAFVRKSIEDVASLAVVEAREKSIPASEDERNRSLVRSPEKRPFAKLPPLMPISPKWALAYIACSSKEEAVATASDIA